MSTVELIPLAQPVEVTIDVSLAADPLPRIEQLDQARRRWKLFALLMTVAFVGVSSLAAVQYGWTLVAVKQQRDTRQHADQARAEMERLLAESRRIQERLVEDRRDTVTLSNQLDLVLRQLGEQQLIVLTRLEDDPHFRDLRTGLTRQAVSDLQREAEQLAVVLRQLGMEAYEGRFGNPFVPGSLEKDDDE